MSVFSIAHATLQPIRGPVPRAAPQVTSEDNQMRVPLSLLITGLIGGMTLAVLAPTNAAAADGKAVYNANCAVCHNYLPPKLGDKAAWAPRLKQGTDALVAAVVKGKGTMPPKAGKPGLSENDIKAAVEYMVTQSR